MKKVLAIVLAVAMVLSLMTISVSAGTACFDFIYLINEAGEDVKDYTSGDSDLGQIKDVGAAALHVQGWYLPGSEMESIGYGIDGGEVTWGIEFLDEAIFAHLGSELPRRFKADIPVTEGQHTINMVCKLQNGDIEVVRDIKYANSDDAVMEWANISNGANVGLWLREAGVSEGAAAFTATEAFAGIRLPIYWSSRIDKDAAVTFALSIYKFRSNIENSLTYDPILTKEFAPTGDNSPECTFEFDEPLKNGEYVVAFKLLTVQGEGYLVLPVDGNPDLAVYNIVSATGGDSFNFSLLSYAPATIFGEPPVEEDAPDGAQLHGASFDSFYVDGTLNFGEGDGAASAKLDKRERTVDGSETAISQIRFRGWIGFESAIDQFGYKINDEEPVFGNWKVSTESAVVDPANGGEFASRFEIPVDVSELKGTNTIVAVVKLADGTVVEIDENVKANGAGTGPNTKITFVGPSAPEAELHGASFDTLYINDEMNFGDGDGSASDKLDAHNRTVDGSDGSVEKLRVRGWIGFESAIAQFGYKINDNAPVFGDFAIAPEAAVVDPANGGEFASRFDITIPVEDLKGTNTIVAVVKLADGTIVEIDENVTANGAGTAPNTQLTYVGPAAAPETEPVTEEPVTEAPQTGDASIMAIAMVAVIALAAVLVIRKKVTE